MKPNVVLFKLDFAKAYDKASWIFLFRVMEAFQMARKFICMICIFWSITNCEC
jgi:hypothetical protein